MKSKAAPLSKANEKRYRDLPPYAEEDEPIPLKAYSFLEAGPFLRKTESGVKRLVDSGAIGHVRDGRRRLILGRQIKEYWEGNIVPPLGRRRSGRAR
jgi:hypothetical protein